MTPWQEHEHQMRFYIEEQRSHEIAMWLRTKAYIADWLIKLREENRMGEPIYKTVLEIYKQL